MSQENIEQAIKDCNAAHSFNGFTILNDGKIVLVGNFINGKINDIDFEIDPTFDDLVGIQKDNSAPYSKCEIEISYELADASTLTKINDFIVLNKLKSAGMDLYLMKQIREQLDVMKKSATDRVVYKTVEKIKEIFNSVIERKNF